MPEFEKRTPAGVKPVQRASQKGVERDRLSWLQFAAEPTRYDGMPFRKCGASGLKLPAISLGAWETFGGYRGPETARECIFRAFNLGVTHFDLANNYGKHPGRAETVVGRVLCEMPRAELIVSTKAGSPMWSGPHGHGCSRKSLLVSIDESLQRLGLDYIDIFYAHGPDAETPLEETLAALDHIVRQGKALWVGLSNFTGRAIEEAGGIARHFQTTPVVAAQSVYNLFDRRIEADVLPSAQAARCGVIACSPLAQGLLSDKYFEGIPEDSRAGKSWDEVQRSRITRPLLEKAGRLNELAKARGQTLAQFAIAWVLRRPEVTSVLMGASDVDQVEENVRA
ncbi:MAG: aldo/keto reductase, partial [Spartobacteria bacterium]